LVFARLTLTLCLLCACDTVRVHKSTVHVGEEGLDIPLSFASGDDSVTISATSRVACESLLWNDGTSFTNGTFLASPGARLQLRRVTPGESDVDLIAVYRRARPGRQLHLDVNVFVTGAADLSLEAAEHNPRLRKALATMWEIYGRAEIFPGQVRFLPLPLPDPNIELKDCDGDMPSARAGATALQRTRKAPPGLNVLLVQDIEAAKPVAGYSALPGGVVHDVPSPDGVVLTLAYFDTSADDPLGQTLAHEIGHYLGLFHNVEADGTSVDPLADTPKVPPFGMANLMYYASAGRQPKLTAMQIAAMRRHPLLY